MNIIFYKWDYGKITVEITSEVRLPADWAPHPAYVTTIRKQEKKRSIVISVGTFISKVKRQLTSCTEIKKRSKA